MYTEEELLEAVSILVEDYGYDEDDAIDMIMESYEEELENISEALDILVEDYGYDEEEAIDMIMESYEDDLLSEEDEENISFKDAMRKEWDENFDPQEKAVMRNVGRGAAVGGLAVGGALALKRAKDNYGRRRERRGLKDSHKRQLEHIRKTGRRINESGSAIDRLKPYDDENLTKAERNASYGTGVAIGALAAGGYGAYRGWRSKRKHNKKMDKMRKKYTRIEDAEKEKYRIRNLRGE